MLFFPDGGYVVFELPLGKAVFRCPRRFRHRPAQCDLLHLDVWHNGFNLLRDGGTYSYNCEQTWQSYFKSAAAHNTVQFDDHDQMPALTRFLFGQWPELHVEVDLDADDPRAQAGFADWRGCRHQRTVTLAAAGLAVEDAVGGGKEKAVLRWRLAPEFEWSLKGGVCRSEACTLQVESDGVKLELGMTEGWESLYYLEKTPLPVLEVTVREPATINTKIKFFNH